MIYGAINDELEPIITLSIQRFDGKIFTRDAVVDTGFNGWLSLPPDLITELKLKWKRRGRAVLGDGSECVFDIYEAIIIWDDVLLSIPVDEADSDPLVGMSLMEGYQLTMQIYQGGQVELCKVKSEQQLEGSLEK
jgi:clan AA aspartic protease